MSPLFLRSMRPSCTSAISSCFFRSRALQQHCQSNFHHYHPSIIKNGSPRRQFATNKKKSVSSSSSPKTIQENSSKENGGFFAVTMQRFLEPKVMPERGTFAWYREMVLLCTVFAITGSSTMVLVRPAVSKGLGLQGSMKDGPWSYRICSLVIMTPIYATLLVVVGTVFGRHHYFRHFSVKMWSRFGIPPEMIDSTFHETKKHFRKW